MSRSQRYGIQAYIDFNEAAQEATPEERALLNDSLNEKIRRSGELELDTQWVFYGAFHAEVKHYLTGSYPSLEICYG